MPAPVRIGHIEVDRQLHDFVTREALPGTSVDEAAFWRGFAELVQRLALGNAALLRRRDELQSQIDAWHLAHPGAQFDPASYRAFLVEIGYIVPEHASFSIATENVDPEIARIAGPQLVVPVNNARYALNAANARWGSLYDALYGTDVIADDQGAERRGEYNPRRGARVVRFVRDFLDEHFALERGSHHDAVGYSILPRGLEITLYTGVRCGLKESAALAGYQGPPDVPSQILLRHHNLHVEICIDRWHPIGQDDPAGISDVVLESAVTTIQDCEDSVAAVDTENKLLVYRNWLGLMKGTLQAPVDKGNRVYMRRLNPDRRYRTPSGAELCLLYTSPSPRDA